MEHIMTEIKGSKPLENDYQMKTAFEQDDGRLKPAEEKISEKPVISSYRDAGNIKLTINDIHGPAYLINNNYEIEWINSEAEDKIFSREIHHIKDAESRNIFKLFVGMEYLTGRQTKKNLLEFHMSILKSKCPKIYISNLYEGITDREKRQLEIVYDSVSSQSRNAVNESYIDIENPDDVVTPYHVYHMIFREGTLVIYSEVNDMLQNISEIINSRYQIINDLLKRRMPSLMSFCVLMADLQDSVRICAELPPEEYFELINQVWKCMDGSIKKYYGTYGKHCGDGMVYYFLKDKGSNYMMNAILCALELRESMKRISMEWKIRKNWLNDLYMNIGINEGQEYFGAISSSSSIEFTALGDTVNFAGRLSDFARYGSIWTTKNLMNRLSDEEKRLIRYGIRRKEHGQDIFVEKLYSRIIDMIPENDPKAKKLMDIANVAVTEIAERNTEVV